MATVTDQEERGNTLILRLFSQPRSHVSNSFVHAQALEASIFLCKTAVSIC